MRLNGSWDRKMPLILWPSLSRNFNTTDRTRIGYGDCAFLKISQKRMLRTTNKLYLLRARMFVTLSFTVALIFQPWSKQCTPAPKNLIIPFIKENSLRKISNLTHIIYLFFKVYMAKLCLIFKLCHKLCPLGHLTQKARTNILAL